jgi:hypothetical protein
MVELHSVIEPHATDIEAYRRTGILSLDESVRSDRRAGGDERTEALLRDARSVLRRVDALAAKASTSDDPSRALIVEVRSAAEHLVSQLAHRQQTERRSAKQLARRLR